jgi:uncharacterized membrane protein YphA (DoxX/SURF4 family)
MNVFTWVLQVALAVAFGFSGVMKVSQPRAKLATNMAWVEDFSDQNVKLIGGLEVLAALGLVLPAWTGIAPVLTPIAAAGLVLIMIGAGITHLRRGEANQLPINLVLLALAAVVAWSRFGPNSY